MEKVMCKDPRGPEGPEGPRGPRDPKGLREAQINSRGLRGTQEPRDLEDNMGKQ